MRRAVLPLLAAAAFLCSGPAPAGDPAAKKEAHPKGDKTNFLNADNGLGAAALGEAGLYLGALALSPPEKWRGYPKLGQGPGFTDDAAAARYDGDCSAREDGGLAKALLAKPAPPPPARQDGLIRLSDGKGRSAPTSYDSAAMYQAPPPAVCTR